MSLDTGTAGQQELGALFEEVVRRSGLASWAAPGVLRRALASVGVVDPQAAQRDHFRRALPELTKRMAVYLRPNELYLRVSAIEMLLEIP
ncbi:MAG TPA: hypothetical protein VND93_29055 [Myxococcales bacterium]|jgi:hypothetical protein|nr:hypothetical protein [Myxococcales bacterium]